MLILDANPDIVSKKGLFIAAWNELYKGIIEYRPNQEAKDVDVKGMTVKTEFDSFKGDVLNVVPPQRAGDYRAPGEADHRQQPLVRRRLADDGIDRGAGRARARRRDAVRGRRCRSRRSMANKHAKIARVGDRRDDDRPAARTRRR